MAGRLGHINEERRVGHIPVNGIRVTNYIYGFSGAVIDFDADFFTDTKTNLAALSYWTCKISGIRAEQTTAAQQPQFILSDANFNNKPSIRFAAAGQDRMVFNSSIGIPYDFTLVAVCKINTISSGTNAIFNNIVSGNGTFRLNNFAAGNGVGMQDPSSVVYEDPTPNDTLAHVVIWTKDEIFIDGVSVVSGLATSVLSALNFIGSGTGTSSLISDIARFFMYDRRLSNSEISTLTTLLQSDY